MKMGNLSRIFLLFAFLHLSFAGNIPANTCPEAAKAEPGTCVIDKLLEKLNLAFDFTQTTPITNDMVANLFNLTRHNNGLAPDEILEFWEMTFRWSTLTSLDLTPFKNSRLVFLNLYGLRDLTDILGGPEDDPSTEQDERIKLEYLNLYDNHNFTDRGLSQLLKHLSPPVIETLALRYNNFSEFPTPEDLSLLHTFTELFNIDLGSNKYTRVRSRQFQGLHRLSYITLSYNRVKVEENGLFLGEAPQECLNNTDTELGSKAPRCQWIKINIQYNQLNDNSIHPNHGLASVNWRPVHLDLRNNNITTLREDTWRDFLYAHPEHWLLLTWNPIVCGPETQWLQEASIDLRSKVEGADCINAPGKTVFTFDL